MSAGSPKPKASSCFSSGLFVCDNLLYAKLDHRTCVGPAKVRLSGLPWHEVLRNPPLFARGRHFETCWYCWQSEPGCLRLPVEAAVKITAVEGSNMFRHAQICCAEGPADDPSGVGTPHTGCSGMPYLDPL